MVGFRAVLFCGACLAPILSAGAGPAAAAEQHGKTAKQCNDELKANATEIERAGESASAFFHACWWTTAAGQKTPIEAHPASAKTAGQGSKTAELAAAGPRREREVAAHARHVVDWRERVERRARRVEAAAPETVEAPPIAPAVPPVRAPETHVQETPAPLVEEVPVTVAGVPNAVVLSVLPGFTPWVRDVLNHPAVPGLTAAP